jgi:DNA-binding transcriptional LysR family regulator
VRGRSVDIELHKRNDRLVRVDSENIATFVEVVRKGSLSAAARKLDLPKSTISRRVMRLEQQLGVKLLHRDARKLSLTSPGKRFYDSVFKAVEALDLATLELKKSSSEPSGVIRITAPPDVGRAILSTMFVAFLKRFPDIALDVTLTNRFVDLVQEDIDLAVRAGRVTQPELIARRLCAAELQLAIARGAAGKWAEHELSELERVPFVLYRAQGRTQSIRLEQSAAKRKKPIELSVTGRVNVDDYAVLSELVAAGQGVGLLPSLHVQEGVQAGRLSRIFPSWSSRASQIYLVSAGRQQPERVRLLAEFLIEAFAAVPSV